jgi:uncharacterized protein YggT (Ycf19 family)
MKTVKFFFLACFFLVAGITFTTAGENESYNQALTQLSEKISTMFTHFPFEAIDGNKSSCLMIVTFSVNENHRMENISVECDDNGLGQYVLAVLKRKNIEIDPALDGKNCRVPIRFVNER